MIEVKSSFVVSGKEFMVVVSLNNAVIDDNGDE